MKKRNLVIISLIVSLAMMTACEDEISVEKPYVKIISVSPENIVAKDTVTFVLETNAQFKVFYSGFLKSDFSNSNNAYVLDFPIDTIFNNYKRDNTGLVFTSDTLETIAYRRAGSYNAVFIVTNTDDFGQQIETAVDSVRITVQ